MKRTILFLLFFLECLSLSAQLYSEYKLCISDDQSFKNRSAHNRVYIDLTLFMDNQYGIKLIDQRSLDIVEISYLSMGTYRLVYDTLKLTEYQSAYEMKFIILENGDLKPITTFSGFEKKTFKGSICAFFEPDYSEYISKRRLRITNYLLGNGFGKIPKKGHYHDGAMELVFEEGRYCLSFSGFILSEGKYKVKQRHLFLFDPCLDARLDVVSRNNRLYLKFCYYQFVMK